MIAAHRTEAIMNRMALFASLVVIVASTADATAQTTSPYAGQQQRAIKALSDQEIGDLLEGRGMGLAKAGELNSYPGPLHVLQLADQLGLSDAQRVATDSLRATMRERAVSIGRQIIEAERTLDREFADGRIEPATLRSQLDAIAILQGNLRAVHLETHLAQRSLLTREQISRYDVLRGYGDNRTPQDSHRHGG
jgi:Spy/CpxP family protein refolding chaperone